MSKEHRTEAKAGRDIGAEGGKAERELHSTVASKEQRDTETGE